MTRVALVALETPNASVPNGGTQRVERLEAALREHGADVQIVATDGASASLGAQRSRGSLGRLKRTFLPAPTLLGARSAAATAELRRSGSFDLVIACGFSLSAVAETSGAPVWLDLHDLTSLLTLREADNRRGPAAATARLQATWLARQERTRAQRSVVVSAAGYRDAEEARRHCAGVRWLPTPAPMVDAVPRRAGAILRVGMIGTFGYWANRHAVVDTLRSWLPEPSAVGAEVLIAGPGSERLDVWDGCRTLGRIDDLGDFYEEVDVVAVPVDRGGGIKVKMVEAMGRGLPLIATPHAAEGLSPELRRGITIAGPHRRLTRSDLEGARPVGRGAVESTLSFQAFSKVVGELLAEALARGPR